MHAWILTCAASVAGAAAPTGSATADKAVLTWRGADTPLSELSEVLDELDELGPGPRATIEAWAPFAAQNAYALYLTDDGRVLHVAPPGARDAKKARELIARTTEYCDALLPLPNPGPMTGAGAGGSPKKEGASGGGARRDTWTTGEPPWQRDAETAVLLAARGQAEYVAALESLAGRHAYLGDWVSSARGFAGCTLERPLCAIWLLEGEGLDEFRPENELVHRLATLLLLRRFDRQPPWLQQGLAWHVEEELLGSIYCFPGRDGFVFATEHGDWDKALRAAHRKTESLEFADVAALERGRFDAEAAHRAFGAATFLARYRAEELPRLLESLRELRAEKSVIHSPDGTWTRVPDYQPSAAEQEALLREAAGDDVLTELLRFYRKGKAYKPPK